MIAADTNLVIRHLTEDDSAQTEKVRALIAQVEAHDENVFISCVVLCEVCWVLKSVFAFDKKAIALSLESLIGDGNFAIENRPLVEQALAEFRALPGQFPDHLLGAIARHHRCSTTYTFDRELAKSSNFTLLK